MQSPWRRTPLTGDEEVDGQSTIVSLRHLTSESRTSDLNASDDQVELTERLVIPLMPEVISAIGRARERTNAHFSLNASTLALSISPEVAGDSNLSVYPIGFCASIRDRVYTELSRETCIRSLKAAGVVFNRVFIILKNAYFQNAIQLGNLYIDAANDTVDPGKYWLEWMPIPEVQYQNLESWPQLAEVAERYYRCRVFPNFCFPLLAPLVPLLAIRDNGRLDLLYFQNIFFLKDLADGLPRLTKWLTSDDPILSRQLPDSCQQALVSSFGGNDFHTFPFEYRPSTPQDILSHVRDIVAAARNPAQEQLVLKLMELAPQAVKILRQRAICSG